MSTPVEDWVTPGSVGTRIPDRRSDQEMSGAPQTHFLHRELLNERFFRPGALRDGAECHLQVARCGPVRPSNHPGVASQLAVDRTPTDPYARRNLRGEGLVRGAERI
jgi:hypothetical protein